MRKRRGAAFVAFAAGLVGLSASPAGCAPERVPVGAGGECFVASDCEPGLVCVPQRSGARSCSADISQVAGRPPPMGQQDAAVQDAEGGGPADDAGFGQDSGVDAGDEGGAVDAGSD